MTHIPAYIIICALNETAVGIDNPWKLQPQILTQSIVKAFLVTTHDAELLYLLLQTPSLDGVCKSIFLNQACSDSFDSDKPKRIMFLMCLHSLCPFIEYAAIGSYSAALKKQCCATNVPKS